MTTAMSSYLERFHYIAVYATTFRTRLIICADNAAGNWWRQHGSDKRINVSTKCSSSVAVTNVSIGYRWPSSLRTDALTAEYLHDNTS